MKRSKLGLAGLGLLAAITALAYSARDDLMPYLKSLGAGQSGRFAPEPAPLPRIPHIFDLGIVDANGDGRLDLFTSNHNYRQVLLLAQENGRYQEALSAWGLDQNRDFPGWEQSFIAPTVDKPGLYIYWLGETLTLRAHAMSKLGPVAGSLKMFSEIGVQKNSGFTIKETTTTVPDSPIAQTTIEFQAEQDAVLDLLPPSRGVPTEIELAPGFPLDSVFVGNQRVSPTGRQFAPFLRDRHGLAWADINHDGQLDIYISRGGVGGTIRKLPTRVRDTIRDELLLSGGKPRFHDLTSELGIEKKDCSGRHVQWTDIDGDGRLELFVNCQDRGHAGGTFPKQLWRQRPDGHFEDVAMEVGLGTPNHEIIDFIWMDVDGDGDLDLLANEDKGFFLYTNVDGHFTGQLVFRPDFVRSDVAGLKGEVSNYWRFDGKLAAADFDGDGDLDVFCSSKRGNLLLINDKGHFRAVAPRELGLPASSLNAVWVDYDNDGRMDLHTVPDGLYRQTGDGHFTATDLLAVTPHRYQAAIVHWYDRDNDGRRDMLLALNENPGLWRWWQRPFRHTDDAHMWNLSAWRNLEHVNHWLQIEVAGKEGNPQAIGAKVWVHTAGGTQFQQVGQSDSSFFSQGHYRLYFGLGPATRVERINVKWTNGDIQSWQNVDADQLLHLGPDRR